MAPAIIAAIIGAAAAAAQEAKATQEQNMQAAAEDAEKHRNAGGEGAGNSGGGKTADVSGGVSSIVNAIIKEKGLGKDNKEQEQNQVSAPQAASKTQEVMSGPENTAINAGG